MLSVIAIIAILLPPPPIAHACGGLARPVRGTVVAQFAPVGTYAGHWGVDLAAAPGSAVRAAAGGEVTFAGSVAGRLSVTVHHGGGLRTSYSYLDRLAVGRGRRVAPGTVVGYSGTAHGRPALHWSVRLEHRYVDPERLLRCVPPPQPALRLVPARP